MNDRGEVPGYLPVMTYYYQPPRVVGAYELGTQRIPVTRKPNWFQRKMAKFFFGWNWVDKT